MQRSILILVLSWLVLLAGCATDTEKLLLEASASLESCDMRGAHESFDAAYRLDSSHPDAALGFALTDTILLPEDPEVTSALALLGFTGPIDTELVWGEGGVLEQLRGDTPCREVVEFAEGVVPYPPITDSRVDGIDVLAEGLTAQQLLDHLQALDERFERLAAAYETAAAAMDSREVTIAGGCGAGRLVIQQPELYAMAAVLVAIRAIIQVAPTYDWSFLVTDFLVDRPAETIRRLLTVVNSDRGEPARELLLHAVELVELGASAAIALRTPVPDAIVDWSALEVSFLSTVRETAEAARVSLSERRAVVMPNVTPELQLDASLLLATPPDPSSFPQPIWARPSGGGIRFNSVAFEQVMRPYFAPSRFHPEDSYHWELPTRDSRFEDLFTPVRYERLYDCR